MLNNRKPQVDPRRKWPNNNTINPSIPVPYHRNNDQNLNAYGNGLVVIDEKTTQEIWSWRDWCHLIYSILVICGLIAIFIMTIIILLEIRGFEGAMMSFGGDLFTQLSQFKKIVDNNNNAIGSGG